MEPYICGLYCVSDRDLKAELASDSTALTQQAKQMRTAPAMIESQRNPLSVYFAVPGNINNLTGGYGYDRKLINGLCDYGLNIELIALSHEFPSPSAATLMETEAIFARIPDSAIVIVDGLAFGVMETIAEKEASRLNLIALCHHPLALETGLGWIEANRLRASESFALAAAKAVIVTSAATAQLLSEDFLVPATKIHLACPGTDRQLFAACNNSTPRLLTVATLTKRKGHDLLIKALAQIKHLEWQATWIGSTTFDSDWTSYLLQLIDSLKLTDRINILGNLSDLTPEYSNADAFILPSHFEGYGMAFAEALAFGLPIVAARAGAVPDLVPSDAGILVPPADEHALANAIQTLLINRHHRHQLQIGAQRAALTLPTWENCTAVVANLIYRLRNL